VHIIHNDVSLHFSASFLQIGLNFIEFRYSVCN